MYTELICPPRYWPIPLCIYCFVYLLSECVHTIVKYSSLISAYPRFTIDLDDPDRPKDEKLYLKKSVANFTRPFRLQFKTTITTGNRSLNCNGPKTYYMKTSSEYMLPYEWHQTLHFAF